MIPFLVPFLEDWVMQNRMNLTFHASMEVLGPYEEKSIWSESEEGGEEEVNDCDDAAVVVGAFSEGSSVSLGVVTAF